jgi:hypothetical protein
MNALTDGKGFDFGTTPEEIATNKQKYYEFLFANNNLLREGNSPVFFGQNNVGISFASNTFGPGPEISCSKVSSMIGGADGELYTSAAEDSVSLQEIFKSKYGGTPGGYGENLSNFKEGSNAIS